MSAVRGTYPFGGRALGSGLGVGGQWVCWESPAKPWLNLGEGARPGRQWQVEGAAGCASGRLGFRVSSGRALDPSLLRGAQAGVARRFSATGRGGTVDVAAAVGKPGFRFVFRCFDLGRVVFCCLVCPCFFW